MRYSCLLIGFLFVTFIGKAQFIQSKNPQLAKYWEKLRYYRYSRYLDSTVFYFNEASSIARHEGDSVALFYINKMLGDAYEHHHKLDSTLVIYDRCERLIPSGNFKLMSFLLNDKAYTFRLLYDYDKSAALVLQSLDYAKKSGDSREIANSMVSVAEGFSYLKMDRQANDYYLKAINVTIEAKDSVMEAQAGRYYASFLLERDEPHKAFAYLKNTESIYRKTADSISLAFTWAKMAEYYWNVKKADSCFLMGKRAEKIWEEHVEYIDLAEICLQLGRYYLEMNKIADAELYLTKALRHSAEDINFKEPLYSSLASLYEKKGNLKQAYAYLSEAKQLGKLIKEQELAGKQAGLRIKFDADQKELMLEKEKKQSQLLKEESEERTRQRNYILVGLLFVFVTAGILIYAYLEIKRRNRLLKESNHALELSAAQRLMLLKEVHHRVKNNLTTLKSLFYLQSRAATSDEVKLVLEECQLRIQSMALIHQNLYEGNDDGSVNFAFFLKQLFYELELSLKPVDKEIEINIEGSGNELDMSIALFLGLILNELATNSFKYAFENRMHGKIELKISSDQNTILVVYADNGIGLKNGFNTEAGGFGFKLLSILTRQINATLSYSNNNGLSAFDIVIPRS